MTALALLTLAPQRARAQGWRLVNTDADGNPIPAPWQTPGDDGYYRMFGQTDASATQSGGGYTWWLGPIPSLVSESQPGFGLVGWYPGSLTATIAQANDPRFTLYSSGSVCLKSSQSARLKWVYYDANGSPTAPPAGAPPASPLPGETDGHVDLLVRTVLSTTTGTFSPSATAHADASDGLGGSLSADAPDPLNPSPFQYAVQSVSFYHLVRAAVTGGSAQVTLNAVQNGSSSSALAGSTLNADARFDSRDVTLTRNGARQVAFSMLPNGQFYGEWVDANGTGHGDTIYSYKDYDNNGVDNSIEQIGDNLNWQTFQPAFSGSWNLLPWSPFSWSPAETDDTLNTGLVSMHYRNYSTDEGDPDGQDPPEQRTISETVTDSDGATATANYILTVHDPNELGADTMNRGIENLRMAPNAAYVRSTQDDATLTVYAEQGDSWSLDISADIPWVLPELGLSVSGSYTYSYNAGVQSSLQHVQAGYGTYLEEFDAYKYHTGPITQWDAGGYVGTTTYHVKEPDSPSGGYQAHAPAIPLPDSGIH